MRIRRGDAVDLGLRSAASLALVRGELALSALIFWSTVALLAVMSSPSAGVATAQTEDDSTRAMPRVRLFSSHRHSAADPGLLLRAVERVERLERLGRRAAQRPDQGAVVGVVDLARAMVELELLQRGERAVALVDQRSRCSSASVGASIRSSPLRRRRRNGSATSRTAATAISAAQDRRGHAAGEREPRHEPPLLARVGPERDERAEEEDECRRARSGSRAASRAP